MFVTCVLFAFQALRRACITHAHNTFSLKDDERSEATVAAAAIYRFLLHVSTHITPHALNEISSNSQMRSYIFALARDG